MQEAIEAFENAAKGSRPIQFARCERGWFCRSAGDAEHGQPWRAWEPAHRVIAGLCESGARQIYFRGSHPIDPDGPGFALPDTGAERQARGRTIAA